MSHEEDLKIIEAATDGPWFVANWTNDAGHYFVEDGRENGLYPIRCEGNEARYVAHFDPLYTKALVEKAVRSDELQRENGVLRYLLQYILDDVECGNVRGMDKRIIDRIEELLK